MKVAITFSLLFIVLISSCYFEEIGPKKEYSSSSHSTASNSSSSQRIMKQDSLEGATQDYKVIKMDSQIWTAQNLNEIPKSGDWWCYGGKEAPFTERCSAYGKLYDWEAAKSVCPDGWKLPSKDDYEILSDWDADRLRATSVWDATFGGLRYEDEIRGYAFLDKEGYWWSSTEHGNRAYYFRLEKAGVKLFKNDAEKTRGFSVRCIKK